MHPGALLARRTVVGFVFTDQPADDSPLWLHLGGAEPALCRNSEGFDTDLEMHGNTRTLPRWWLGELRWADLFVTGAVKVTEPRDLQREFPRWFSGYRSVQDLQDSRQRLRARHLVLARRGEQGQQSCVSEAWTG